MTNTSNIYFYGNDKVLKLGKNPALVTIFDVFPATRLSLKKILNHKHQWVSNSGYYIPTEIKGEWVKTVSLCILTLGVLSSYRNAIAEQKGISLNDAELNKEIDSLLPDSLFNNATSIQDLKAELVKLLPHLLEDYLLRNFGEYESVITNGVAKLFIDNVDSLDQQLEVDLDPDNQLSMLKFTKNSEELKNTSNYILVNISDIGEQIKINFTNSKEHADHLSRIIYTLVNDSGFDIEKTYITLNGDEETKQEVYNFKTSASFVDFYNSLLLEVYFYLDHATLLEHIEEYHLIDQTLKTVQVNLENKLSYVIGTYKESGDLTQYFASRAKLLDLVHESAKVCKIELDPHASITTVSDILVDHKKVSFNTTDTFKQIQFI